MKALWLLVAALLSMSFASCKSNLNGLNDETATVSEIVTQFGAQIVATEEVGTAKYDIDGLSPVTVEQALSILQDIRTHKNSEKSCTRSNMTKGDGSFSILMSEKVADIKLSVQLNLVEMEAGALYYKNYQAECASSVCKWYISGFSFSNDNQNSGGYKFASKGFLNLMVLDNGVKYLKVPFTAHGTFDPATQNADFSYSL